MIEENIKYIQSIISLLNTDINNDSINNVKLEMYLSIIYNYFSKIETDICELAREQ